MRGRLDLLLTPRLVTSSRLSEEFSPPVWLVGVLRLNALLELDPHTLAGFFADRAPQLSLDGQLVGTVADRHGLDPANS